MIKPILLKELDIEPAAVSIFEHIADLPGSILLESGMQIEGMARYSFMSADPFMTVISRGKKVEVKKRTDLGKTEYIQGDILEIIRGYMKKYQLSCEQCPIPFPGGAAGFFSYDLGRQFETIFDSTKDDLVMPDCWLGFYDLMVAVDHAEGRVYIASSGFPFDLLEQRMKYAEERMKWLEKKLTNKSYSSSGIKPRYGDSKSRNVVKNLISNFDKSRYIEMVETAKEYIAAGDIFQVNLSQRFQLHSRDNPWEVYKRLSKINPAPMAAYINCGRTKVVSASPERFLKVSGGNVETRPIKGTRPRGETATEDRQQRHELWNSEKDRAELVMIVDLERNDLGKVCVPGSVQVKELYRLEEYPTVFHLVSTVQGELEDERDIFDLIRASFPGGSITGAPKKRAMEIIEELESVRRGIYCGSIGYMSFNGESDLNIVIRTLVFVENSVYFHVGGGITIDSIPQDEYQETLDKAKALMSALGLGC